MCIPPFLTTICDPSSGMVDRSVVSGGGIRCADAADMPERRTRLGLNDTAMAERFARSMDIDEAPLLLHALLRRVFRGVPLNLDELRFEPRIEFAFSGQRVGWGFW